MEVASPESRRSRSRELEPMPRMHAGLSSSHHSTFRDCLTTHPSGAHLTGQNSGVRRRSSKLWLVRRVHQLLHPGIPGRRCGAVDFSLPLQRGRTSTIDDALRCNTRDCPGTPFAANPASTDGLYSHWRVCEKTVGRACRYNKLGMGASGKCNETLFVSSFKPKRSVCSIALLSMRWKKDPKCGQGWTTLRKFRMPQPVCSSP